ncbi:hypothetical protein [Rubritalea tangerina]|uniref:Uncharacterized protein n=1 Tax=Rubritalea tangerina TaxID=430798 RepID=A0ABW4ZBK1_9BACT
MKTLSLLTSLTLTVAALAEGGGNYSFNDAAKKYDAKAEAAEAAGNQHNADIYRKLADIKRDAAKSKGGYDWSEYHQLQGQLKHDHKKHTHKAEHKKTKYSFDDAAQKYEMLAKKAREAGANEKAAIYSRMAAIKREAQAAGGKYDWSEYHALEAKLHDSKHKDAHKNHKHSAKQHPQKTQLKTSNKLIEEAQNHASLANKANDADDNYAAQIHTRLAAICIDAAAKGSKEEFDWTEYKELKEMLKNHKQ